MGTGTAMPSTKERRTPMTFGSWDSSIHESVDQIKRIAYMQRIKPENISLNPEIKTAIVEGSSGTYNVSLDECTCFDFESKQLPCKHMYRLAFELGYLTDLPKVDKKAAKEFKNSIPEEIERYKKLYLNGAMTIEKFNKILSALNSK